MTAEDPAGAAAGAAEVPAVPLRHPDEVMRLARLGCIFPTRISFMRSLIRRMRREAWTFDRRVFDLDDEGYGVVVWHIGTPFGPFAFVAFSTRLAAAERTDRVIAEKWDASFALLRGAATPADIERLRSNVPRQEAGRYSAREIVLSRANRSARLYDHVVDSLAAGRQPDAEFLCRVGYLMRTTAVYGNGKLGMADLSVVHDGPVLNLPYQAEMLMVWMIRHFTVELVEHVARRRNPEGAARLSPALRRALGIGNATGLGMAPFLVSHPKLINQWFLARETALARVRAAARAGPGERARFLALLDRAIVHVRQWNTADDREGGRLARLREELADLRAGLGSAAGELLPEDRPWDALVRWCAVNMGPSGQELVNSLVIELRPDLVDDLEEMTGADERMDMIPEMAVADLAGLVARNYGWATGTDYGREDNCWLFWYRSEEKEEPRLGRRLEEPGADRETRIDIARRVAALEADLAPVAAATPDGSVAEFLIGHPRHRGIVRRVQALADCPWAEIRDNLLGRNCLPIDILRAKLAIFGAGKYDPKSELWVRINMYQGAPFMDELAAPDADDWSFPAVPA